MPGAVGLPGAKRKNAFHTGQGVLSCLRRMRRTCAVTVACLAFGLLAGCRRDEQIQTYQTPKENVPPAAAAPGSMAMMGADAVPAPASSTPPHWTTPSGWQEMRPNLPRLGDFVVSGPDGKKAEVTVMTFPGDVGGVLANVNRWRGEVGLGSIAENAIVSEKAVVDSNEGKLFDLVGATERTVVAMIPRNGASWFFKMRGDKDLVAAEKPAFLQFLSSVHFGTDQAPAAAADPHAGIPGMGMGMSGMGMGAAAAGASDAEPKWSAPTNWTETASGPMVRKSFSIAGDAGQKAAVSISVLAGEGGGTVGQCQPLARPVEFAGPCGGWAADSHRIAGRAGRQGHAGGFLRHGRRRPAQPDGGGERVARRPDLVL